MELCERLKAERERLQLTQPRVGELLGVGKTTVINWEKGASAPTAVHLAVLSVLGVDVLYVLTGKRDRPAAKVLTADEQKLLERYAEADDAGRKMAHRVLGPDPDQVPVAKVPRRGRKTA